MKSLFLLTALALSATAFAADTPANPHAGLKLPGSGMGTPAMTAPMIQLTQQGTVLSSINVPEYTYVEASQGKKTIWLAGPSVAVKKGDAIRFDAGMEMSNFYSKTLKRNFASIYFVNRIVVDSGKKK